MESSSQLECIHIYLMQGIAEEKPQSPTIEVSEKLSRGGTPTAEGQIEGDGRTESPPKPESPQPGI